MTSAAFGSDPDGTANTVPDWDARRLALQDAFDDPATYLELLAKWGRHDPQQAAFWCAAGPGIAMELGDVDEASRWLRRALDLGWFQAELVSGFLEVLSAQPDAERLRQQLRGNIPPKPLELLDWPDAPPSFALPAPALTSEREDVLRQRLPPARETALTTALSLLTWVQSRWKHAGNADAGTSDALELLERSQKGERFRCVEYSALLTSALQARGIPALTLGLKMDNAHAGIGAGHVVTAAWLDDSSAWVVLDGQNGGFWHDGDCSPLAATELERRCRAGEGRPHFSQPDETPVPEAGVWWLYFAQLSTESGTFSSGGFTPIFQGQARSAPRITRHQAALWPDLAQLSMGVSSVDGRPVLKFTPLHPYARGVVVEGQPVPETGLPFPMKAGDYAWTVQTLGPYGPLAGQPLRFTVRG
ncbi:transglutaminase-like domain-containing protein [Deinococcus sp.]|uniref:transglutaminase-like domain-containing protein n=1 Tax=Deinococcus sp. TaxID=47478 RepID=UPI003B5A3499